MVGEDFFKNKIFSFVSGKARLHFHVKLYIILG